MATSRSYALPPAVVFGVGILGISLGSWVLVNGDVPLFGLLFVIAGAGAMNVWESRRRAQRKDADRPEPPPP